MFPSTSERSRVVELSLDVTTDIMLPSSVTPVGDLDLDSGLDFFFLNGDLDLLDFLEGDLDLDLFFRFFDLDLCLLLGDLERDRVTDLFLLFEDFDMTLTFSGDFDLEGES